MGRSVPGETADGTDLVGAARIGCPEFPRDLERLVEIGAVDDIAHRAEKWARFSASNDASLKDRSIGPKNGIHFWIR